MKVAIVINELNIRGGTHKQVLRLCEYLEEQKIEMLLLTKYYDPEKTYPEFEKYHPVSLYDTFEEFQKHRSLFDKIRNTRRFLKMVPDDYEIVNIHDGGLQWITCLATFRKNTKVVWQINDLPSCFRVGVGREGKTRKSDTVQCRFNRWIASRVDAITVNVTKNKERVESCMGKAADVFYCGVDVNGALKKHEYHNEMKHQVKLLSTGVFFSYRNYETLVLVVDYLRSKGYKVKLDIIGSTDKDKDYANKILALIKEKKLENDIKIWGQVDEITYNTLYNQADIFAFINIDQSWGLTVFEAMSAGIPTLVSNSVGAIELLHNGEDAIIVEPKDVREIADQMIALMEDGEYYNHISEKAYNAVKDYTWEKLYSSKMVKLFDELLRK